MLTKGLRKAVVSALLGVSVLSTTVTPALPATVSVQAATKIQKPSIKLKNTSITVGVGSYAQLGSMVNSIGAGTYRLKSIKVTSSNTSMVKVTNSSDWSAIKMDFKKAGSCKLTVRLTDVKGNSTSKEIKVAIKKVSPLLSYVKGLKDVTMKKGSRIPNLMKGVSYTRKYVDLVSASNMGALNKNKVGTQTIKYYVMGSNGERLYVNKKLIVK